MELMKPIYDAVTIDWHVTNELDNIHGDLFEQQSI